MPAEAKDQLTENAFQVLCKGWDSNDVVQEETFHGDEAHADARAALALKAKDPQWAFLQMRKYKAGPLLPGFRGGYVPSKMDLHVLYRLISSALTSGLVILIGLLNDVFTAFQAFGLWTVAAPVAFTISSGVWWTLEKAGRRYIQWKVSQIELEEKNVLLTRSADR